MITVVRKEDVLMKEDELKSVGVKLRADLVLVFLLLRVQALVDMVVARVAVAHQDVFKAVDNGTEN